MSEEQKFEVARYCIENRCVIAATNPDGTIDYLWRVQQTTTAQEVTKDLGIKVTPSHLRSALDFHALVCKLSGNMPVYPAMESPMEMDRLVGENKRYLAEIERLKSQIGKLDDELRIKANALSNHNDKSRAYLEILQSIGKLIPAAAFEVKRHPSPR